MQKKSKNRVSIINQDDKPIIKIKKQHFVYILQSGLGGFALGITFSLFIGLVVSMAILKPLLELNDTMAFLIMFAIMLVGGFIGAYMFLKSDKDLKPFYFQVEDEWYTLWWHNKEKQARKGKHANLHIQITKLAENKNNHLLKFTSRDKDVYETRHLSFDDVAQIRGYLKKYNVMVPK